MGRLVFKCVDVQTCLSVQMSQVRRCVSPPAHPSALLATPCPPIIRTQALCGGIRGTGLDTQHLEKASRSILGAFPFADPAMNSRKQGGSGRCWIFAVTAIVEDALRMRGITKIPQQLAPEPNAVVRMTPAATTKQKKKQKTKQNNAISRVHTYYWDRFERMMLRFHLAEGMRTSMDDAWDSDWALAKHKPCGRRRSEPLSSSLPTSAELHVLYDEQMAGSNGRQPANSEIFEHCIKEGLVDGGQWHFAMNILEKYGIVFDTEMPETYNSQHTSELNRQLQELSAEYIAIILFSAEPPCGDSCHNGKNDDAHKRTARYVASTMREEYAMKTRALLNIALGTPPEAVSYCFPAPPPLPPPAPDWLLQPSQAVVGSKYMARTGESPTDMWHQVADDLLSHVSLVDFNPPSHSEKPLLTIRGNTNILDSERVELFVKAPMETILKAVEMALYSTDHASRAGESGFGARVPAKTESRATGGMGVWFGCDVAQRLVCAQKQAGARAPNFDMCLARGYDFARLAGLGHEDGKRSAEYRDLFRRYAAVALNAELLKQQGDGGGGENSERISALRNGLLQMSPVSLDFAGTRMPRGTISEESVAKYYSGSDPHSTYSGAALGKLDALRLNGESNSHAMVVRAVSKGEHECSASEGRFLLMNNSACSSRVLVASEEWCVRYAWQAVVPAWVVKTLIRQGKLPAAAHAACTQRRSPRRPGEAGSNPGEAGLAAAPRAVENRDVQELGATHPLAILA